MKSRRTVVLASLLACAWISNAAADWNGEYAYDTALGRTHGGSSITASYVVRLGKRAGSNRCEIEIIGFQTHEHIVCTTKPEPDAVTLLFKSYQSGIQVNQYGIRIYRAGQPLLRFERSMHAGRSTMTTRWIGLQTIDERIPKTETSFKRVAMDRPS